MDIRHPSKSAWICVERCPTKTFLSMDDIEEYARVSGTDYCMYPKIKQRFSDKRLSSNNGVCPTLPVFKRLIF